MRCFACCSRIQRVIWSVISPSIPQRLIDSCKLSTSVVMAAFVAQSQQLVCTQAQIQHCIDSARLTATNSASIELYNLVPGQAAVMPCGREGNRRSTAVLHHGLHWLIGLRARCLDRKTSMPPTLLTDCIATALWDLCHQGRLNQSAHSASEVTTLWRYTNLFIIIYYYYCMGTCPGPPDFFSF